MHIVRSDILTIKSIHAAALAETSACMGFTPVHLKLIMLKEGYQRETC
jgi:hypothetical protein